MNKAECLKIYNERVLEIIADKENMRIVNNGNETQILFHKDSTLKIYKDDKFIFDIKADGIIKPKNKRNFVIMKNDIEISSVDLTMKYVRLTQEDECTFRLDFLSFDNTMIKILTDQFVYGRETKYPKFIYNLITENGIEHKLVIKMQLDMISNPIELINISSENQKLLESQQTLFSMNINHYAKDLADIFENGVGERLILMNNRIFKLLDMQNQMIRMINVSTNKLYAVSLLDFIINNNPFIVNDNKSVYIPSKMEIIKPNGIKINADIIHDNMDIINKRIEFILLLSDPSLQLPENTAILEQYRELLRENNRIIKENEELYTFIMNNSVVIYSDKPIDISMAFQLDE